MIKSERSVSQSPPPSKGKVAEQTTIIWPIAGNPSIVQDQNGSESVTSRDLHAHIAYVT